MIARVTVPGVPHHNTQSDLFGLGYYTVSRRVTIVKSIIPNDDKIKDDDIKD